MSLTSHLKDPRSSVTRFMREQFPNVDAIRPAWREQVGHPRTIPPERGSDRSLEHARHSDRLPAPLLLPGASRRTFVRRIARNCHAVPGLHPELARSAQRRALAATRRRVRRESGGRPSGSSPTRRTASVRTSLAGRSGSLRSWRGSSSAVSGSPCSPGPSRSLFNVAHEIGI